MDFLGKEDSQMVGECRSANLEVRGIYPDERYVPDVP